MQSLCCLALKLCTWNSCHKRTHFWFILQIKRKSNAKCPEFPDVLMLFPVTHWCPTMHLLPHSLNTPKHVMWTVSNIHCGGEMDYLGMENELSYGAERACVSKYAIRMLCVNDLISAAIRSASVLPSAWSGTEGVSGWRWMNSSQRALIQCSGLFICLILFFLIIFNDCFAYFLHPLLTAYCLEVLLYLSYFIWLFLFDCPYLLLKYFYFFLLCNKIEILRVCWLCLYRPSFDWITYVLQFW